VHRFAVRGDLHGPFAGLDDLTLGAAGLGLHSYRLADGTCEVVAGAERPVRSRRRDLDAVVDEVAPQDVRDAFAEGGVDALSVVDEDAEALLAGQLEREHVHAGQRARDQARDLALERSLLFVLRAR